MPEDEVGRGGEERGREGRRGEGRGGRGGCKVYDEGAFHSVQVVDMVLEPDWINTVSYTPLLRFSVLAPLLSEYFPDGVGISPSTVRHVPRGSVPTEPPKGEPHPSQEGGGAKTEEGVVDKKLNGRKIVKVDCIRCMQLCLG